MWGRPDGGLDTHPAPPHAHTLLHSHALHFRYTHSSPRRLLHTPTRTPYATHLPVDSAPVHPPLQQSDWSARAGAWVCSTGCSAKTPILTFTLPGPTATAVPHPPKPSGGALCPHPSPTPKHTHLRGISFLSLAKSHLGEPREVQSDSKW